MTEVSPHSYGTDFDPVRFYREFPQGGEDWLRRCLTAMCDEYARSNGPSCQFDLPKEASCAGNASERQHGFVDGWNECRAQIAINIVTRRSNATVETK